MPWRKPVALVAALVVSPVAVALGVPALAQAEPAKPEPLWEPAAVPEAAHAPVGAEQPSPERWIGWRGMFATRGNPIGLVVDGRAAFRHRLYRADSPLFHDNFVGVGFAPTLSPTGAKFGPTIELDPLSVLGLSATIQGVQYFGTFGNIQPFEGAGSGYAPSFVDAHPERALATSGYELAFAAHLRAKIGHVVAQSQLRFVTQQLTLPRDHRVYLDATLDVLAPNGGYVVTNDADAAYLALDERLLLGARYTISHPFFRDDDYARGAPVAVENHQTHRVGPMLGYALWSEPGASLDRPTFFLLVQWWTQHPYRTGADVNGAIPLVAAGILAHGDLVPAK